MDSFIGIYHPAHANRFKVRYVFGESVHPALSLQTLSADIDLKSKSLDITFELPLHTDEVMDDLITLCTGRTNYMDDCIVIDYLEGDSAIAQSIHCFLEEVVSCELSNDYASSGTVKVYLNCKVRQFMADVNGN
jgi:hypothetical protein